MSEKTEDLEVKQTNLLESEDTFCDDKGVNSPDYYRISPGRTYCKGDTPNGVILDLNEIVAPKLAVEDDLELHLLEVFDVPQDILFPQELNLHLQEKIKCLSEEKSKLSRILQERETEIQLLKARIYEIPPSPLQVPIANGSPSVATGPAEGRIMELGKRCAVAEQKVAGLQTSAEENETSKGGALVEPYKRGTQDYRALVDKINVANAKLFDSRNQLQQLRSELKMAYKVLQSEVGQNVSISTLMTGAGGWRGRAQQIQVLQQRVADLTTKLRSLTANQRCNKQVASGDGSCQPHGGAGGAVLRKTALKEAQKEAADATAAATDAKKRLEASKARIHLLSSETANLRTRLRQLLDKGTRDEEYIKLMQSQAVEQTNLLREKDEALRSSQQRHDSDVNKLKEDLGAERQRCQQLSAILGEKDSRIHMLEGRLWEQRSESTTTVPQNPNSDAAMALRPADSNHQNTDTLVMAERLRLLELVGVVNGRLSAARKEVGLLQEALQRERQRTARLETRLSRLELDRVGFSVRRSQHSRLAPLDCTDVLTDKLQLAEERVLTLQTRIDTLEKEKEDDLRRFAATLATVTSRH